MQKPGSPSQARANTRRGFANDKDDTLPADCAVERRATIDADSSRGRDPIFFERLHAAASRELRRKRTLIRPAARPSDKRQRFVYGQQWLSLQLAPRGNSTLAVQDAPNVIWFSCST